MPNAKKSKGSQELPEASSLTVAKKGIVTGHDFANFMSALMSDLISGNVSPNVGNAACNAGGKLLKVVEMQMRHGTTNPVSGAKVLTLALNNPLMPDESKLTQ